MGVQVAETGELGNHANRANIIAEAFDTAFEVLDIIMDDHSWEDTPGGREQHASEMEEKAKAANRVMRLAMQTNNYSEYDTGVEIVYPAKIRRHGKL